MRDVVLGGSSPSNLELKFELYFYHELSLNIFANMLWIMAPPAINFNAFLEKEKLKNTGSNFTDWFCNLRIVLNAGQKTYVLDAPLGDPPAADAPEEVKNVYLSQKEHQVLMVSKTTSFKKQGKPKKGNF